MHPPSRARRMLKWTGVGLTVAILAAWGLSLFYRCTLAITGHWALNVDTGVLTSIVTEWRSFPGYPYLYEMDFHEWRGIGLNRIYVAYPETTSTGTNISNVLIPMRYLLLLTAIPTAWLWHRDRRLISASPDHRLCLRCGYDLSGNTSGVCPECGEKTAMANSK